MSSDNRFVETLLIRTRYANCAIYQYIILKRLVVSIGWWFWETKLYAHVMQLELILNRLICLVGFCYRWWVSSFRTVAQIVQFGEVHPTIDHFDIECRFWKVCSDRKFIRCWIELFVWLLFHCRFDGIFGWKTLQLAIFIFRCEYCL